MKSVSLVDQPVILEKPAMWSHLFLWMIMLITTSGVVWAYFSQIEQTVPAVGELEYKEGAREIQAPTTGAVVRLHVENGDRVQKNQPLLTFSPTNPSADIKSLAKLQGTLNQENEFYKNIIQGNGRGTLPPEWETMVKDRDTRIQENQVLNSLINELYNNQGRTVNYSSAQGGLVTNYRAEYQSRVSAVEGRIIEFNKQLEQTENLIRATREQVQYATNQIRYSEEQLNSARDQLNKSQEGLDLNQSILGQIAPLVDEGAMSDLNKKRQEQEVLKSQNEFLRQQDQITTRQSEINARKGDVEKQQAEIKRLEDEKQKVLASIERTQQELQNTKDAWAKDLYLRIEENKKQIASIDSQLSRYKLENEKRLGDVNAQLEKVEEQRDTQVLRSPVAGVIYDLKPSTKQNSEVDMTKDDICNYVNQQVLKSGDPKMKRCNEAYYEAQQTEKLMQILADDKGLGGTIFIKNTDLALVLNALRVKRKFLQPYDGKTVAGEVIECKAEKDCICPDSPEARSEIGITDADCIPVEVTIDAFPNDQFGMVSGQLKWLSQDAIKPDPEKGRQYFSFKGKVKLDKQSFVLDEDKNIKIGLQSGMSVNTKINVGKRSVLDIFLNRFTGRINSITNLK
ncbi:HlyD family secretion protein [Planktothrix sp. PCC 11201]|uniref:chromosome partitioning protein ParA n=1 Tax=Planktothrix sp. PCC 11201 TaxID=1729650 RepID=UPI0009238A0D|nr:chromosome partitioning protein ParA [Planktothrix sp. PCC 11201]SKB12149.1 HlyD family secretion protein [Planktothrix sp. PCC 11201]